MGANCRPYLLDMSVRMYMDCQIDSTVFKAGVHIQSVRCSTAVSVSGRPNNVSTSQFGQYPIRRSTGESGLDSRGEWHCGRVCGCAGHSVHRFMQWPAVSVVMCIPMSSDVPHPARVHWREVAKHDQLHGKTPGGTYVCKDTEGDAVWYGADLQIWCYHDSETAPALHATLFFTATAVVLLLFTCMLLTDHSRQCHRGIVNSRWKARALLTSGPPSTIL